MPIKRSQDANIADHVHDPKTLEELAQLENSKGHKFIEQAIAHDNPTFITKLQRYKPEQKSDNENIDLIAILLLYIKTIDNIGL